MDLPDPAQSMAAMNVRFGSIADSQRPKNFRMAGFGAENASANVRFRPIADIANDELNI
jgi:hypothetical protein